MAKSVRISLANKCQILFGAAVLLILTVALAVVWQRMVRLAEQGPNQRAVDVADLVLSGQVSLGEPAQRRFLAMPPDPARGVTIRWIPAEDVMLTAVGDPELARTFELFEKVPDQLDRFVELDPREGPSRYRYYRVIKHSDVLRLDHPYSPGLSPIGTADPVRGVLVIELGNRAAQRQAVLNRVYIIAAGTLAGLLAIAVFWFITTRLILSPVRLLRVYAQKVAEGDIHTRSDINTGDEFEDLSEAFNTMLETLRTQQDRLEAANKTLDLKLGELAESNVALYEANKIKGEFLANVSHDLRTPLNSIIGFAEVLQETLADQTGPMDEKRKRYAGNIILSSRRLLELINDLLDLAKIEAGRLELNLATVSVSDTIEGLVNLIRPQAEAKAIAIKSQIELELPAVETDPGRLQQVLFNFLSNAVKFTPNGGNVTVTASLIPRPSPAEPALLRIAVSDTGPGLAEEDIPKIFEKFTQLDPSVTREHGGTGLGLTIAQELADLLQSRIEVESAPGQGATFALIMPLIIQTRSAPLMPDIA